MTRSASPEFGKLQKIAASSAAEHYISQRSPRPPPAVFGQRTAVPSSAALALSPGVQLGIMPRSKEISDELRKKVVEAHKAGKGYKTISKVFALHSSTVRQIVYKWKLFNTTATRPRTGRPTKLDISLRKVRKAAGTPNRKITLDGGGVANGEDATLVSGTDKCPESANITVHTGVEDHVEGSMNPAQHSASAVTTPKRKRVRVKKIKDLKLMCDCALTSPPTHSSSQPPIILQSDATTSGPVEHHLEVILCCEICGACFPTEPDLEVHQAQHLAKMLHECEECGKVFQSAGGLKTHKKRKHGC